MHACVFHCLARASGAWWLGQLAGPPGASYALQGLQRRPMNLSPHNLRLHTASCRRCCVRAHSPAANHTSVIPHFCLLCRYAVHHACRRTRCVILAILLKVGFANGWWPSVCGGVRFGCSSQRRRGFTPPVTFFRARPFGTPYLSRKPSNCQAEGACDRHTIRSGANCYCQNRQRDMRPTPPSLR